MEQQSKPINSLVERNQFDSNDFFLNCGDMITVLLINLAIFPLLYVLTFMPWKRGAAFITKLCKEYKWDVFIRFWIESYLEIGFAAVLQMFSLAFDNFTNFLNSICALVALLLLIFTPVQLAKFFRKSVAKIKMGQSEEVKEHWESLFYEFCEEGSEFKLWFYFWFLLRRLIYILNQVFLIDYPGMQIIVNISHSLIVSAIQNFLIVLIYRPYQDKYTNIIMIISDFGILAIFVLTGAYIYDIEDGLRKSIKDVVIYTVFGIMGVQFIGIIISLAIAIQQTIQKLRQYRRARKLGKIASLREASSQQKISPEVFSDEKDMQAANSFQDEEPESAFDLRRESDGDAYAPEILRYDLDKTSEEDFSQPPSAYFARYKPFVGWKNSSRF